MKIVVNDSGPLTRESAAAIFDNFDSFGRVIYSGRNVVRVVDSPAGELAVKRFKVPNMIQRCAYSLMCRTKAHKAYDAAGVLKRAGVGSPDAVAYGEGRRHGLIHRCFFACVYSTAPTAAELAYNSKPSRELIGAIAAMGVRLHEAGVMHGDLNLTNILVDKVEGNLRLNLIDTNRTRIHPHPSRGRCLDNLVRLTHNRPILSAIGVEYARMRGWNPELTVAALNRRLDRRERQAERKKAFKKALVRLGLRKK